MKDNRNLKRIDDIQRRFRLLQLGKVDVVSFLSKLPKTLHCPRSLLVDVPVASVSMQFDFLELLILLRLLCDEFCSVL